MKHPFRLSFRTLGALCLASAVALGGACAADEQGDTDTTEIAAREGAPTKHREHKDPAAFAAMMKDKLGLSDAQVAQLEKALAEVESREDRRAAFEAILTPEQLAQLDEMKKSHMGKRGHEGKHGDPAAHAAKLQEKLGLTDEQTAQIEAALADSTSRKDKKAAFASILTADQLAELEAMHADHEGKAKGKRGHHKDPAAHAAMLQEKLGLTDEQTAQIEAAFGASESREDHHKALESILTADQLQQLDAMREHHGKHKGKDGHERKR